jgi:hypothetical protein
LGRFALANNTTGQSNIGVGPAGGFNLTTGSNNIDIGNVGAAAESKTIRIGTQGIQTRAFIAGISGTLVSGSAVVVSSTGQMGIVVSSARFKRDIHDMGATSEALMKLRPITFRYKQDRQGERQYGLIAEEVAQFYPELVNYDTDGKVISVRYYELVPMLLNEAQLQAKQIQDQTDQNRRLSAEVRQLKGLIDKLMAAQKGTHLASAAGFNKQTKE